MSGVGRRQPEAAPTAVEAVGGPAIIVITGMSGAGRTQVAKVLEDLDWFVIDNLPPALVSKVVELAFVPGSSVARLAVVADVRGREFFGQLIEEVRSLRASDTANLRVVFLEADDDTLVRRYEAARRRHPAGDGSGVLEGIRRERTLLREVRGMADLILDTTDLNVHELRDRVVEQLGAPGTPTLSLKIVSFGFKHGAPRDADIVLDVRFLPNPHWVDSLRPYTGQDAAVRDYVLAQDATGPFLDRLRALLDTVVPGYVAEGKRYLTIAVGCTGGRHRSVCIADEVAAHLVATTDLPVTVEHRDLDEE